MCDPVLIRDLDALTEYAASIDEQAMKYNSVTRTEYRKILDDVREIVRSAPAGVYTQLYRYETARLKLARARDMMRAPEMFAPTFVPTFVLPVLSIRKYRELQREYASLPFCPPVCRAHISYVRALADPRIRDEIARDSEQNMTAAFGLPRAIRGHMIDTTAFLFGINHKMSAAPTAAGTILNFTNREPGGTDVTYDLYPMIYKHSAAVFGPIAPKLTGLSESVVRRLATIRRTPIGPDAACASVLACDGDVYWTTNGGLTYWHPQMSAGGAYTPKIRVYAPIIPPNKKDVEYSNRDLLGGRTLYVPDALISGTLPAYSSYMVEFDIVAKRPLLVASMDAILMHLTRAYPVPTEACTVDALTASLFDPAYLYESMTVLGLQHMAQFKCAGREQKITTGLLIHQLVTAMGNRLRRAVTQTQFREITPVHELPSKSREIFYKALNSPREKIIDKTNNLQVSLSHKIYLLQNGRN